VSELQRPFVEARGLGVRVGPHALLHDVGITIAAGERVALVGHNGAGKSTLLRSLSGFARVSQGSLRVLDTDMARPQDAATLRRLRARVAQVHQGLHLVGRWSALDNVLIGGAARSRSPLSWLGRWPAHERASAIAALARVGMGGAAGRRTDSLSGGERQKVAIARALHQGGALLPADDPPACLDAAAADEVVRLLREVASERQSALVCVVHDLELLPRLADRVIALRRGAVLADMTVTPRTPAQLREMLQ
jgi:phosphonate transport system ATP-binding protein